MHKVILSLGTNTGDKEKNLRKALHLLEKNNIKILKASRTVETPPWGNWNQPDFLNMAILVETRHSPIDMLKALKQIEKEMGRTTGHMKPRIIDIDIILFDKLVIKTDTLEIPHPSYRERGFVLEPLMEIAPEIKDPLTQKTIRQLYAEYLNLPFVGFLETPIGKFYISVRKEMVLATSFKKIRGRMEYTPTLGSLLNKLQRYFAGEYVKFDEFNLQLSSIPHTYKNIYNILGKTPYGTVISYSKLAELAGIPKGARVVGNAMKKNPLPIIIPCHRVIRSNGKIGNYSAGSDKKIFLLKLELKSNFSLVFPQGIH